MSALATLFLAVVALYLLECLVVAPEDAIVLVERRGSAWRIARHGFALNALHRRVVLLSPFAPHAGVFVLPAWTVALGPSEFTWSDSAGHAHRARYADLIALATDGSRIRWTSGALAAHSPRRAQRLTQCLTTLRDTLEEHRAAIIESVLTELTSVVLIRDCVARYRQAARWPRIIGVVLFAHLFVIWPAAVQWLGIPLTWPTILIELGLLVTLVCWLSARGQRALCGKDTAPDGALIVPLALSPPAAVRAPALLSRDLLGAMHPLAVVATLCGEDDAGPLVSRAWREAQVAGLMAASADDGASAEWFAAHLVRSLRRLIDSTVGIGNIAGVPSREGESAAYCPRCWTQYTKSSGECVECDGLALVAFSSLD